MERNVTVILMARTTSKRCPGKVINPFAQGKSLFEIMCERLKELRYPYAAGVGEEDLIGIAEKNNVPIFRRSMEEVNAHAPLKKVFKCVEQCKTSHAMIISPCTPFVTAETINKVCDDFCANEEWESLSSVVKEQNWFFDENKKPLVPINIDHMTTNELCVYALGNVIELFPVDKFLKEGIYYTFENANDPYLYEIPKQEAFDIDDPEDFELGRHIWEQRLKKQTVLQK